MASAPSPPNVHRAAAAVANEPDRLLGVVGARHSGNGRAGADRCLRGEGADTAGSADNENVLAVQRFDSPEGQLLNGTFTIATA